MIDVCGAASLHPLFLSPVRRPMAPSDEPITPEIVQLAEDLFAHKLYFVGCFALLFFDYFLTLAEEVKHVWKGKKSPMFYLFLMNRYCPMAFCIITLFAYFASVWDFAVRCICNRFAIVEWLQTLLIVVPAEMVLLFRVYALTNRNKLLAAFLGAVIAVEIVIVVYAMSLPGTNNALPLPNINLDPFHVCILFSDPKMDTVYLSLAIAFDSIVFIITIISTITDSAAAARSRSRPNAHTTLLKTIRWDGTMYFCVILSGNVAWMVLAVYARPGLKLMNAQPSMYLTSVMINRLTLSVRKTAEETQRHDTTIELPTALFSRPHLTPAPHAYERAYGEA
ncbi:hypothetical protein C8J57DRAFT_1313057 [Mycena rebaudengoi]|nr:hypothetical protein C8J57DRAFT_1313057 [Mycena rebaudengoi]